MISVSHVSKAFNGQKVLNDISFEIPDGEIWTILGASGSGKSVLLRHLIGLLTPDQGTIKIQSVDITRLREKELLPIRKKFGYLFQEGALYDFMTTFDNVAFPLREHFRLTASQIEQKVHDTLKEVDLEGVGEKFPAELSGGMKKRAALARAMVMDSKILFCDEPTSGLDPIRSRDISDLIRNVSRRLKSTTVITSHDICNSLRISDYLILINDGAIIAQGKKDDLLKNPNPFVQEFLKSSVFDQKIVQK